MKPIDFPIERINQFFNTHLFEVFTQPTHDDNHNVRNNIKVKLTGVKNYISVGDSKPHVEYTMYVLHSGEESDMWNSMYGKFYGTNVNVSTTDHMYDQLRWVMNHKLSEFLKYFGVDMPAICTKVVNEVGVDKLNESIISEGKYDGITRALVRDIIQLYKFQREGEFDLPESITGEEEYEIPNFDKNFSITLNLIIDDSVKSFDIDAEYYDDEEIIYITIKTNPELRHRPEILQDVLMELNEIVRHELEHIKQYKLGSQKTKEYKDHEKYYSQQQELEAQRAGFKRRSKQEKKPMEYLVRKWFDQNKHKYKMNPDQIERVIQKILNP